jgi:hypothetical protein
MTIIFLLCTHVAKLSIQSIALHMLECIVRSTGSGTSSVFESINQLECTFVSSQASLNEFTFILSPVVNLVFHVGPFVNLLVSARPVSETRNISPQLWTICCACLRARNMQPLMILDCFFRVQRDACLCFETRISLQPLKRQ